MDKLYAIRDAFFWWLGVWACMTLGNRAITKAHRYFRRKEYAQYQREFMAFMLSEDARPEGAKTEAEPKMEEAPEESEADNATET